MSSSDPPPKYPFHVAVAADAAGELASVRVSDGRERVVGAGEGAVALELPPGIYPVRVERAGEIVERVFRHSAESPVDAIVEAPRRESVMPSLDTRAGEKHYASAAAELSRRVTGSAPVDPGADPASDPRLFLFVRAERPGPGAGAGLGRGVELADAAGNVLSTLGASHVERSVEDGWLAMTQPLRPGFYRLRHVDLGGTSRAMPVHLFADWDTQVFVGHEGRAMLESAVVYLARRGAGFDPADPWAQASDIGLKGLEQGRDLVPPEVMRVLLHGKFDNPMVGLVGAHLYLAGPAPSRSTADIVLGNLQSLLGGGPDLDALRWSASCRLGLRRPEIEPREHPPMLRAGLRALLKADAEVDGGLIAPDGLLAMITTRAWDDGPWTMWRPELVAVEQPVARRPRRRFRHPMTGEVIYVETPEDFRFRSEEGPQPWDLSRYARLDEDDEEVPRHRAGGGHVRRGGRVRVGADTDDGGRRTGRVGPPPGRGGRDAGADGDPGPGAAGGEGRGETGWIDALVADAVESARRREKDVDLGTLARASQLPVGVLKGRVKAYWERKGGEARED